MRYTILVETFRTWSKRLELEWRLPDFEFPTQPEDQAIIYKETCVAASESILFDRALPFCLKSIRKRIEDNNIGMVERLMEGRMGRPEFARFEATISIGDMKREPWKMSEFIKRIEVLDEKGETVIGWGEWWEGEVKDDKT